MCNHASIFSAPKCKECHAKRKEFIARVSPAAGRTQVEVQPSWAYRGPAKGYGLTEANKLPDSPQGGWGANYQHFVNSVEEES